MVESLKPWEGSFPTNVLNPHRLMKRICKDCVNPTDRFDAGEQDKIAGCDNEECVLSQYTDVFYDEEHYTDLECENLLEGKAIAMCSCQLCQDALLAITAHKGESFRTILSEIANKK